MVGEEARAYLQTRLTSLFKLLFWCFVALMAFMFAAYERYPEVAPVHQELVYATIAGGITIQAVVWRGVLLRKRSLSLQQLHRIDAGFAIGASIVIAACALIAFDRRQSAYTCLIYTCWTVLTRALIVPSTGRRTAMITALAMVPMGIAVCVLMAKKGWGGTKDVPPPAMIVGYLQIGVVAVLLSAQGSRIIYGLRQKASEAEQLGQYTLGRRLGAGGKVYVAQHALLRRPTAIKLVVADRNVEQAVHAMSQLTHPNTVAVYDYGYSRDRFYFAMEYLGGGIDLQKLFATHGRQPPERVRQILLQACGALAEAHGLGFHHGNLKPSNILVCERGGIPDFVKLVDYGLAASPTDDTAALCDIGRLLGLDVVASTLAELRGELEAMGPQAPWDAAAWWRDHRPTETHLGEGETITLMIDVDREAA